ncbi:hypothetical protein [Sphingomicrobium sediminis]|uniref:Uncharacterized protein n=1 Tax=Sphingomicrobium sediminis TaxID=2950949 RepID=A0A9X2J2W0_9SPHN|nr:hypothetical protein [Sphingomicrobium sediminis]MCM8556691.1 hypothetical protein [Sphingomicrobium sediminis]
MNAPKAFASLSSGLLARKGSARPAMRRQGAGKVGPGGLDDLGWNDMGFDPPAPAGEESENNIESINRTVATGLTPSQPVVHDQQAQIAREFGDETDEGDVYDGADLEDDTAELWDPEADEAPNSFNEHRSESRKADAFGGGTPVDSEEAGEAEPQEVITPALDTPPVSQSIFSAKGEKAANIFGEASDAAADEIEAVDAADEGDEPKLMRTVADLMPLTDAQKAEGSAWGDEEAEDEQDVVEARDVAEGLSGAAEEDEYGEEEEATAHEEADEDFDPTANNRFAAFIRKPAFPAEEPSAWGDAEDTDEEELVLGEDMQVVDEAPMETPVTEEAEDEREIVAATPVEHREVSRREVAEAKAGAKDKAAFTLRLDRERHLKLRLACALTGQSAQKMVTEALDRMLAEMEELDGLVKQAGVEGKE